MENELNKNPKYSEDNIYKINKIKKYSNIIDEEKRKLRDNSISLGFVTLTSAIILGFGLFGNYANTGLLIGGSITSLLSGLKASDVINGTRYKNRIELMRDKLIDMLDTEETIEENKIIK